MSFSPRNVASKRVNCIRSGSSAYRLAFAILLIILEFMIGTLLLNWQPLRVHLFVHLHSLYTCRGVSFQSRAPGLFFNHPISSTTGYSVQKKASLPPLLRL